MSPAPRPRRLRSTRADQERFPCSLIDRSAEEAPDSTPATSLRLPRSTSPQPPLNQTKSLREFPNPPPEDGRHRVRVASGPYPPDSSRCDLEGRKRRFLTYAFPPRSPGPHHLAVLTRPGFVGAACHPNPASPRPGCPQLRSPAATEPRSRSLTSTQSMCTSRRTRSCSHSASPARDSCGRLLRCPHRRPVHGARGLDRERRDCALLVVRR